jgi:hypothetical protein
MTTKTEPQGTLWVCTDCLFAREGEAPESPDREPWGLLEGTEVTSGMTWEEHADDCPRERGECECEVRDFDWRACDGCGSPLGGERHAYTYWS